MRACPGYNGSATAKGMPLAFSGLAVSMLVLGILELARGKTVPGLILLAAELVSGLVWGAKGGVETAGTNPDADAERAKTSAISRWRNHT
jgi:hypothetical protein